MLRATHYYSDEGVMKQLESLFPNSIWEKSVLRNSSDIRVSSKFRDIQLASSWPTQVATVSEIGPITSTFSETCLCLENFIISKYSLDLPYFTFSTFSFINQCCRCICVPFYFFLFLFNNDFSFNIETRFFNRFFLNGVFVRTLSLLSSVPFITVKYRKIALLPCQDNEITFILYNHLATRIRYILKKFSVILSFVKSTSLLFLYTQHTFFSLSLSEISAEMDKFYQTEMNLASRECSKYLYKARKLKSRLNRLAIWTVIHSMNINFVKLFF